MEWNTALILISIVVVIGVFSGLPIAIVLFMTSLIFLTLTAGPNRTLYLVSQEMAHFWSSWSVLAAPLFILMGELLLCGGFAAEIFDMASKWLRRFRGGLALVTTVTGAIFASMSGSSSASVATMSIITVPEMLKRGYSRSLASGAVIAAGSLAHIIPPSILIILYASFVEISPGRALVAGYMPGIALTALFAILVTIWVSLRPNAAPPQEPSVTWHDRFFALRSLWQPIIIIGAVIVTLYVGIVTATEAAGMGAVVTLIMVLSRKSVWGKIPKAFIETARITCFVLTLAAAGKTLALTMSYYMIPQNVVEVILGVAVSPLAVMAILMIMYLFLGCFLDPLGMMVVTLPVVMPVITALGFDPYWFGIMLMVSFEIGLVTPPYGPLLYILKATVPELSLGEIIRGALLFLIAPALMLIFLYMFPQIALWLPSTMWE